MRPAGHGGKLPGPRGHQLLPCHLLQVWSRVAVTGVEERKSFLVLVTVCLFVFVHLTQPESSGKRNFSCENTAIRLAFSGLLFDGGEGVLWVVMPGQVFLG